MKNLLKVLGLSVLTLMLFSVLIGCGPDAEKIEYTLTSDVESLDLTIGEANGVVNVTTNGTFTIEMENTAIATATKEGKVITVVPVAKGSTTLVIASVEDKSLSVEIPITVKKSTGTLTLTLADDIAIPGGTITVSYGAEETHLDYELATATVSEDGKSAVCELKASAANEYGWLNGIVVTVKNSSDVALDVTYDTYFEYNADGMSLALSAAIQEKTYTINFEGFTISGGSVTGLKYTKVENDWETEGNVTVPVVTVSDDGTKATFTVSKATISDNASFQINLTSIVIKDSENNVINPTDGIESDIWADYTEKWGSMATTISIIELTDADYTGTIKADIDFEKSGNPVEIVAASELTAISAKAIKITYTVGANDVLNTSTTWITIYSSTEWANETKLVNAWNSTMRESDEEGNTYSVYIKASETVSAFLAGGFFVACDGAAYTGKISISYVPEAAE